MDRRRIKRFVYGGPRGYAPVSWLGYGLITLTGAIFLLITGQFIVGVFLVGITVMALYKMVSRYRGSA
jgi:hypothetical protein